MDSSDSDDEVSRRNYPYDVLKKLCLEPIDVVREELLKDPYLIRMQDIYGRRIIHWAARCNNKLLVHLLLECDRSRVNERDSELMTPLLLAVRGGHLEVALLLLSYEASVRDRCRRGRDAVSYACSSGASSLDMMQLLLQHGAYPQAADRFGDTPLHQLATEDCEELLLCLINAGVDLNATNIFGETALHVACRAEQQRTAELLLDHGALDIENRMKQLPSDIANVPMRCMLLHRSPPPFISNFGSHCLVRSLFPVPSEGFLRMDTAESVIESGEISEPHVESPAPEVDESDEEEDATGHILQRLSLNSPDDMKDELLEHPDAIFHRDKNDRMLIDWAGLNNKKQLMEILLSRDREMVSVKDDQHKTPLLLAMQGRYLEVALLLLNYEASVRDRCGRERDALSYACSSGASSLDMRQLLLQYGVDPKVADGFSDTPLHQLATKDCEELLLCLINAGVDLNAQNIVGDTALDIACQAKQQHTAELLLDHGALAIENRMKQLPIDIANVPMRRMMLHKRNNPPLIGDFGSPSGTALSSTGGGSGLRMDAAESAIESGEINEPHVESPAREVVEKDGEEDSTINIAETEPELN